MSDREEKMKGKRWRGELGDIKIGEEGKNGGRIRRWRERVVERTKEGRTEGETVKREK